MSGARSKTFLCEAPRIHLQAVVTDCDFGAWTKVGQGPVLKDIQMAPYSYIMQHYLVVWTTIGELCSIAYSARIHPVKKRGPWVDANLRVVSPPCGDFN